MNTKILTKEAAQAVRENFRWFGNFYLKINKLSPNKYACTSPQWCWSHFVLLDEDYA